LKDKEEDEINQQSDLEKALSHSLPGYAIRQIITVLTFILDRVSALPSPWLEALTPFLIWFTLHSEDGLVKKLFEIEPQIVMDLSRVHKMICNYIICEQKKVKDEDQ
jgi:hypothetical protein